MSENGNTVSLRTQFRKDHSSDNESSTTIGLSVQELSQKALGAFNQPAIGREGEPLGPKGAGLLQWSSATDYLKGVTKFDTMDNAWKNGLWWAHLICGGLYLCAAIVILFLALFWTKQRVDIFWEPMTYNNGGNFWQIYLAFIDAIRLDFLLLATQVGFGLYHLAHLIPFVRNFYNNSVVFWQFDQSINPTGYAYNWLRWAMWGVVGGAIISSGAMVLGQKNVELFAHMWGLWGGLCGLMLMMEMYNPHYYPGTTRRIVNWTAFGVAAVLALFILQVYCLHFAWIVHDQSNKVGWYQYATFAIVILTMIGVFAVNGFYWTVSFIRRYVYVEAIHLVVELFVFFFLPGMIILGFGTVYERDNKNL